MDIYEIIKGRLLKKFGNKGTKNKKYVINLEADTVLTCFNIIVISIQPMIRSERVREK
jgi:hypothetical protein